MIFLVRLIVAFILLAIASHQDIKTREVFDWIWKVMFIFAILLLIIEINLFGGHERETILLELFLMSMMIVLSYIIFVGFNKWQKGSFGGADAKAFMCLALLLPYPFIFGIIPFSFMIIIWAELLSFAFYFPKAMKVPKDEWKNITFPLIPFILAGLVFSLLIFLVEEIMI